MTVQDLNNLEKETLAAELGKCCGAAAWVSSMADGVPFLSENDLLKKAEIIWSNECNVTDWFEAFTHHPKIGDVKSLQQKFASTKDWAAGEQAGVQKANDDIIAELAEGNKKYEEKFGFIFIVCATGKTAEEMLNLLNDRLPNDYEEEIKIAAQEQNKITQIRLKKLLAWPG
jgi:2-oxo-4-hydroxy-4-carboxy-5-ureidoimidazoline decarboxylase